MSATNPAPACLIIAPQADALAEEIRGLSETPMPITPCCSPAAAVSANSGESVLLGDPQMIADLLPELPAVRWVQSTWAGVKPLIAGPRRDYLLTAVTGVFGPQMAEYVLGYLLARELKIDQRREAQHRREWQPVLAGTLSGKTMGIMGTGSIGRHIAETAGAFDIEVRGLSRSGRPTAGFTRVDTLERLEEFLETLDYLVCALPETAATTGLLNATTLAQLPRHACIINVGRANLIDHAALSDALHADRLGGAVLDVFDSEPLPADSTLWETPNLSITAHVAAISHPRLIAPLFVENYRRFTSGQPLQGQVDFDTGY